MSPPMYFGFISLPPSHINSSSSLSSISRFPSLPTQELVSHVFLPTCIVNWTDEQDGMLVACVGFGVHFFVP